MRMCYQETETGCMRPFHDIPHIYTAEYEHYLRELKLPPARAGGTALLTFIPSHPANHEPTLTKPAMRMRRARARASTGKTECVPYFMYDRKIGHEAS